MRTAWWLFVLWLWAIDEVRAGLPVGGLLWQGDAACEAVEQVRVAPATEWTPLTAQTPPQAKRAWVRFPLPTASPVQMLAISAPAAQRMLVYRPGVPVADWRDVYLPRPPHTGTAYWHSVLLTAPAAGDVLVCLESRRVHPALLEVLDAERHIERELDVRTLKTAPIAVMLAMAALALSFWLALGDRIYLHYLGHVLGFVVWAGLNEWALARFLTGLPGAPVPTEYLRGLSLALSTALTLNFNRRFLDLARCAPAADQALRWLVWALILLAVAEVAMRWTGLSAVHVVQLQNLLVALAALVMLVTSFRLAWQGHRYARYFCVGWTPFLLLVFLAVALTLLDVPSAQPIRQWLLPAAAFEAFLLSIGLADRTLALKRERDAAMQAAERDSLTGVLNRRGFEARWEARAASDHPGALLICDLDHFKRINDQYGHPAGDQCLKRFAERAERVLPPDALLGRFGGEEFLVYLPSADGGEARRQAELLRAEIAATPVVVDSESICLTVSIGVLIRRPGSRETLAIAIARADAALYRAKSEGRNRVVIAESDARA